jgi:hypothetical protein
MLRAPLVLGLLFSLSACMNQVGGNSGNAKYVDDAFLTASQKAFKSALFPTLVAQCSQCHGFSQAPLLANPASAGSSHDSITTSDLVSLGSPSSSVLVRKIREGHNCWSADCDEDADSLLNAIRQWAETLDPDAIAEGELTEEITIPATTSVYTGCSNRSLAQGDAHSQLVNLNGNMVPNSALFPFGQLLQFDLRQTNSQFPNPTTFSVRIRVIQGQYEICDPQINTTAGLQVTNVRIFINGVLALRNSSYSLIDVLTLETPPFETNLHSPGGPLLSPGSVLVPIDQGAGQDKIFFEFETLDFAP